MLLVQSIWAGKRVQAADLDTTLRLFLPAHKSIP